MINRVVLNETSYFGRGSRNKLGEELRTRGHQKVRYCLFCISCQILDW